MASLSELLAGHGDNGEHCPPDYLINAPAEVRRRVAGLKGLQLDIIAAQADFYQRVHALEVEFRVKYNEINAKRTEIVDGAREPTEKEATAEPLFHYMDEEARKKFDESVPVNGGEELKGIPNFWLNVLKNAPQAQEMITDDDEEALKYLRDITVENIASPPGFTVTFHFAENPFFTNTQLTKEYSLSVGPNGVEPTILYDGPSVVSTNVVKIDWKDGKDLTKKVLKKKQKKGANAGRYVVKTVDAASFFQYFSPPETKIAEELPEEAADVLNGDFELGQLLRETIVDNAVLYYTGEVADDDSFDYGDEDFDEDDDEDEE